MDRRTLIRSVRSAVLFTAALSLILQSWRLALTITLSLLLHEFGHVFLLHLHHVPWEIRFTLLGAATLSPREARQQLSHFENSQIHLAGSMANLAAALVALMGHTLQLILQPHNVNPAWLQVANLSALLVLTNLLPLGTLSDGGKFLHRLFASLTERTEENIVLSLLPWLASIVWLVTMTWGDAVKTLAAMVVATWFILVTLVERHRDDPHDAHSRHSMTRTQGLLLFGAMAMALLTATGIAIFTPSWFTPTYAERMAYKLVVVFYCVTEAGPLSIAAFLTTCIMVGYLIHRLRRRPRRHPGGPEPDRSPHS